jgi:hypothetical protein
VSRGRQLYVRTGKRLRLTGTCVSTGRLEWFDHVATPHMAVCVAVRASSAIPFLFQASGRYTAIYTAISAAIYAAIYRDACIPRRSSVAGGEW